MSMSKTYTRQVGFWADG